MALQLVIAQIGDQTVHFWSAATERQRSGHWTLFRLRSKSVHRYTNFSIQSDCLDQTEMSLSSGEICPVIYSILKTACISHCHFKEIVIKKLNKEVTQKNVPDECHIEEMVQKILTT